jgi:hypothetical protein
LDDGGNDIDNYQVWRGTSSGTETIVANAGLHLCFNDTSLINGITYYYKVSAMNDAGEGAKSNEVTATPQRPIGVPSVPQNLVVTAGDGKGLTLFHHPFTFSS